MSLISSIIPSGAVVGSDYRVGDGGRSSEHQGDTLLLQVDDNHSKLSTSLLFQAALSAGHMGDTVTYIKREAFSRLPYRVNKMPTAEPVVMNHLKFMYLATADDLLGYLASFHTLPLYPDLMIVEDLSYYLGMMQDAGREVSIARLCAAIRDVLRFMKDKSKTRFRILVSTHEAVPINMRIYQRYFPDICLIRGDIARQGCQLQFTSKTSGDELDHDCSCTVTSFTCRRDVSGTSSRRHSIAENA